MGEDLADLGRRILIQAPTSRDATVCRDLLESGGVPARVCADLADVCREITRGAGAALVTQEAVLSDKAGCLAEVLAAQPPWSDFPLIVLTPAGDDSPATQAALLSVGHMTLMKRPVQVAALRQRGPRGPAGPPEAISGARPLRRTRAAGPGARREREPVPHAGRVDPPARVDGPAGRLHLLVQPPLVRVHGHDPRAGGGLGLAVGPRPGVPAQGAGGLEGVARQRRARSTWSSRSAAPTGGSGRSYPGRALARRRRPDRRLVRHQHRHHRTHRDGAALKQADRRKDEFLAMLAHELRNPLAAISQRRAAREAVRLAATRSPGAAQVIEKQVRHLTRMIDDLLDVSRITRGKVELRKQPVDAAADPQLGPGDRPPAHRAAPARRSSTRSRSAPVRSMATRPGSSRSSSTS